jgi:hypothetical protein
LTIVFAQPTLHPPGTSADIQAYQQRGYNAIGLPSAIVSVCNERAISVIQPLISHFISKHSDLSASGMLGTESSQQPISSMQLPVSNPSAPRSCLSAHISAQYEPQNYCSLHAILVNQPTISLL